MTSDLQASHDRVADEYAQRIHDELQHKPLLAFGLWPSLKGRYADAVA
jgi:hypothetical protein